MTGADLCLLIVGLTYGAPVLDRPDVSSVELDYATAVELGIPCLVFMLDNDTDGNGELREAAELGQRQEEFRRRLADSGIVISTVRSPAELGAAVHQGPIDARRSCRTVAANTATIMTAQARASRW